MSRALPLLLIAVLAIGCVEDVPEPIDMEELFGLVPAEGSSIATLRGHTAEVWSVAFSPDGNTLASGSWDSTVKLWDVPSELETATLQGHTGWVTSVAFSPEGDTLASGSEDTTIKL